MVRVCFITHSDIFTDCFQNEFIILHIRRYYILIFGRSIRKTVQTKYNIKHVQNVLYSHRAVGCFALHEGRQQEGEGR